MWRERQKLNRRMHLGEISTEVWKSGVEAYIKGDGTVDEQLAKFEGVWHWYTTEGTARKLNEFEKFYVQARARLLIVARGFDLEEQAIEEKAGHAWEYVSKIRESITLAWGSRRTAGLDTRVEYLNDVAKGLRPDPRGRIKN